MSGRILGKQLSSFQIIIAGFLAVILAGALLLSLPFSSEAVMMASSHNPDVLFLDLGLPDMDGIDVIRQIRSWSNMPVIGRTAGASESHDPAADFDEQRQ